MKKKLFILIAFVAVVFGLFLYRDLHIVKFNGIKLKMSYTVDKSFDDNRVTITRLPPDGSLLILSGKKVDFGDYERKVLRGLKTEKIFDKRTIDLKRDGKIQVIMSRLSDSPQSIVIHGYINRKEVGFTFYGDNSSSEEFISILEKIEFYD